ncbi:transposase [Variovorax sp. J31P179]|uniref:transposase n=1 Tax=Variovorax sp. J31P179 TaxID=3053508 RepID=UPI002574D0D3|nr:transposase [Variovorax sp. J31P179]MDM0084575.1 transposase [Variovorax sp. J31P179]
MDTSGTTAVVAEPLKRSWRRHSDEFRARVIELARQPNTSVAAVALANGLNANMLRRWMRESEAAGEGGAQLRDVARPAFVPLPMPAQPSLPMPEQTAVRVEVEIHRNGTTVRASLPMDGRSAAWLREVTA